MLPKSFVPIEAAIKTNNAAEQWKYSEGAWIPKEFRNIFLLNVKGKIFLSILSRWPVTFLLKTNTLTLPSKRVEYQICWNAMNIKEH